MGIKKIFRKQIIVQGTDAATSVVTRGGGRGTVFGCIRSVY